MIRNLLATTAVAALLATGAAQAQDATQPAPAAPAATEPMPADAPAAVQPASGHLATSLIGESVYNGSGDQAENIGDVNDMVIGDDGMVSALVIGVGGFLGIAEKNVAIDFKQASWAEKNGDRWLVVETTKEALEALPDFDRTPYEPAAPAAATDTTAAPPADQTAVAPAAPADTAAPADQTAAAPAPADEAAPADQTAAAPAPADEAAPADQTAAAPAPADEAAPADKAAKPAAPADQTAQAPADPAAPAATDTMKTGAIDKSTLTPFDTATVRAEDLIGTTVYGAEDANVGEIGDVVMTQDGKVDAIIIDVGGFLGVGEKEVAVGMDNLAFLTDKDGNKYLYTTFTKEQLDAQAAYDKSTWAEKRDDQRLIVR